MSDKQVHESLAMELERIERELKRLIPPSVDALSASSQVAERSASETTYATPNGDVLIKKKNVGERDELTTVSFQSGGEDYRLVIAGGMECQDFARFLVALSRARSMGEVWCRKYPSGSGEYDFLVINKANDALLIVSDGSGSMDAISEKFCYFHGNGQLLGPSMRLSMDALSALTQALCEDLALAIPDGEYRYPRIDLNVPFMEKEIAKELGARWDSVARTWYLPPCDEIPYALIDYLPQAMREQLLLADNEYPLASLPPRM